MNKDQIIVWMHEQILIQCEWLAGYFADVVNQYAKEAGESVLYESAIKYTIKELKGSVFNPYPPERIVKEILFDALMNAVFDMELADKLRASIPYPKPPLAKGDENDLLIVERDLLKVKYGNKLQKLQKRRTPAYLEKGRQLAETALAYEGWFHWISSGPSAWKDTGQSQNRGQAPANHFAQWINANGQEPSKMSNMNCWEAVYFAAYKAGAVSRETIREIHKEALRAAQQVNEFAFYDGVLAPLGGSKTWPIVTQIGLWPVPGDILFFGSEHHVALCVGELTHASSKADVPVMSLWKHPKDGFNHVEAAEFGFLADSAAFAPCPFLLG
jgi:hypothetical protein